LVGFASAFGDLGRPFLLQRLADGGAVLLNAARRWAAASMSAAVSISKRRPICGMGTDASGRPGAHRIASIDVL
jgi:hypothetical protein